MKDFTKFLILENDIEHQGLPDTLKRITEAWTEIPYEVWWWFSEDIRQHADQCLDRFKNLEPGTVILSNPSFAGYGNSFTGKLHLFAVLKSQGIKLDMVIVYYPNFFDYVLNWFYETASKPKVEREKQRNLLKEVLEYHNVTYVTFEALTDATIRAKELPEFFSITTPLTYELIIDKYYSEKSKVRQISTGRIVEVFYVSINPQYPEYNKVSIFNDKGGCNSADDIPFNDIEKIIE